MATTSGIVVPVAIEISTRVRTIHDAGHGACPPARHLHGLTALGGGSARQRSHVARLRSHIKSNAYRSIR
eukprot:scaffold42167_cov48-Phaeocystis_antarctica.AAC.1